MIVKTRDLGKIRNRHKDRKIVLISGVFDLFHFGHLRYIKKAKKLADILVVNVVNNKRVKVLKGKKRPIVTQYQRIAIIDSFKCVDYVVVSPKINEGVSMDTVKKLKPDIFLADNFKKAQILKTVHPGIKIVHNPRTRIIGTSELIERIIRRYKK